MAPESIVAYSEKGSDAGHPHHGQHGSASTSPSSPKSPHSFTTGASEQALLGKHNPMSNSSFGGLTSATLEQLQSDDTVNDGWPLLAKLMDKQPEFEAFARFRELNIKNLLYYQVELDYLKEQLEHEEARDKKNSIGVRFPFYKFASKMVHQWGTGGNCEQWKLVLELRKCLHGYNEALLQYAGVSALPEPNTRNIAELVKWISMPEYGNFTISGRGSQVWGPLYDPPKRNPNFKELFGNLLRGVVSIILFRRHRTPRSAEDLVAPRPGRKADFVARWIAYDLVPWCADFITRIIYIITPKKKSTADVENRTDSSSTARTKAKHIERMSKEENKAKQATPNPKVANVTLVPLTSVNKFTSFIATVVACVLPTGAIAVLTTAGSNLHKLLWIGGFTLLFSMGLAAFTHEISRVQIFMAAAAFSAVLVVFVQNQTS